MREPRCRFCGHHASAHGDPEDSCECCATIDEHGQPMEEE